MPDHVHLLVEGTSDKSSLPRFIRGWKQATGYRMAQDRALRLWQPGYFERVLREQESNQVVARYILENPVRAQLTGCVNEYPFAWCVWGQDPSLWD